MPFPAAAAAGLTELGDRLLAASLAAVVILGVALLLARALPPAWSRSRALVLWLGLARALAELAGAPALELAWLQATPPATAKPQPERSHPAWAALTPAPVPTIPSASADRAEPRPARSWPELALAAAAALWLAGLAAAAVALGSSLTRLRRTVRSARPLDLASIPVSSRRMVTEPGRRPIEVTVSSRVGTPQAIGWLRPRILLPERALALPAEQLALALLHERVHLERRDTLLALVPALAERLFFFHPLVRRAVREFAWSVEAACDAEVLRRSGAPPDLYGRLLLRMVAPPSLPGRLATAWPLAHSTLARRLDMLARTTPSPARRLAAAIAFAAALLLALPIRLVAGPPVHPTAPAAEAAYPRTSGAPPAVTPLPPAPAARPVAASPRFRGAAEAPPPVPPIPAALPAPPAPPAPPTLGARLEELGIDWLVLIENGRRYSFASGPGGDSRAESLRRGNEPLAWFVRDGREWVVRDPAWLARLGALLEHDRAEREVALRTARDQARLARDSARLAAEAARTAARESRRAAQAAAREAERFEREDRRPSPEDREALEVAVEREIEQHLARVEAELDRSRAELDAQSREIARWSAEIEAEVAAGVERLQQDLAALLEAALEERLAEPVP